MPEGSQQEILGNGGAGPRGVRRVAASRPDRTSHKTISPRWLCPWPPESGAIAEDVEDAEDLEEMPLFNNLR